MARKPLVMGPRLETLLDERDHLRIKINLADHKSDVLPEELAVLRRKLFELDREILKQWETPGAP